MLDYISTIKSSIEKGNTDPYIFDEFFKDIRLASYDYDYMLQKDLIDYYEYEFTPNFDSSYIGKNIFDVSNNKNTYFRCIDHTIHHKFIIQGEMENYKKSNIFNKYLNINDITTNLKYFHYNLLVYIDDTLFTDYMIKPYREKLTLYFKTEDLKLLSKNTSDPNKMPNKIKILFLPNALITTVNNLNSTIATDKTINANSFTNIKLFHRVDKYIAFVINKNTGNNFLYTISSFDKINNKFTLVDNLPGNINNCKLILIGMNEIRNITNVSSDVIWFNLNQENMPIPKNNIMIFIKKGNIDSYIPNDNTVSLTEYYPNIYKINNPNRYQLRLIILYEYDEVNSHIIFDDEIKLYRDKVDLLKQYKENSVPDLIAQYKPIEWDYNYNNFFSKIENGYNGLDISNLNKPNAYKADTIANTAKKWYKFYEEYEERTYNGFLSGWYHNMSKYSDIQLQNKEREDNYIFTYKNLDDDLSLNYLYYIDGKLTYPTKIEIDKTIQSVYFPKSLISKNSVIEIERFDGIQFEKKLNISESLNDEGFVSFNLSDKINTPIIANSLFLVKDTGEFIDPSRYNLRIHDTKLGALYLDTNISTYKISPNQTIMIFPKDKDLYNKDLLLCCNNRIVYYNEEEDGTFFTTGKADKVNLNRRNYIVKVKSDIGTRIRIYTKDGRLIPKRGYTVYKNSNYNDPPKFNVVIHGDEKQEFTIVYIGYDEKLIYHRDKLPLNGFISIEGRTSRPFNFAYHDIYLDGYRLTKYDIEQLSPFKLILKNYDKYQTNITLEIYEKNSPTDNYIKYRYNEFSDYTMDLVIDDENKNIKKEDILDQNIKNKINTDKVSFRDIIEVTLTDYDTTYPNPIIDSIHDDYLDLLRYYLVYQYMNGDKRVDLEAFYHIFNDIGRAILNADDRIRYSDKVNILYYLNHNLSIGKTLDIPDKNLTSQAVIPDTTISVPEETYMKYGFIDNNFNPVYNEPFVPQVEVELEPVSITPNPVSIKNKTYVGLDTDYPILNKVKIRKYVVNRPLLLKEEIMFNNREETILLDGFNPNYMSIGGIYTASRVNSNNEYYRASVTPKEGFYWSDTKTNETIYFNWRISKRALYIYDIPVQKGILKYTGAKQSPTWNKNNSDVLTIDGTLSASEAGIYEATFTPTENAYWADGTVGPKTSKWAIGMLVLDVPYVTGIYTYDEYENQTVSIVNFDADKMIRGGDFLKKEAGTYTVTLTPIGDYVWSDTASNETRELTWTINRKKIINDELPVQTNTLYYVYYLYQSPTWSVYNIHEFSLLGTPREINVSVGNGYAAKFAPNKNYCWKDGSITPREAYWHILPNPIEYNIQQKSIPIYNGNNYNLELIGFDEETMLIDGTLNTTNAGEFTVYITPQYGYVWSDTGTRSPREFVWYMKRQPLANDTLPKQLYIPIYDKKSHYVELSPYDENKLDIDGRLTAIEATTEKPYEIYITPKNNYCWTDGTSDTKTIYWYINLTSDVNLPYQLELLTYNGKEQTVQLGSFDSRTMILEGDTKKTNAGTYTILVTPKQGYLWSDTHSSEGRYVEWIIKRQPFDDDRLPVQSNNLVYEIGVSKSPEWSNYDKVKLSINGVLSGIDAKSYNATFTPTANYCWSTGTFEPRTATWNIKRQPFDIDTIPEQIIDLTYIDGTTQYPTWSSYSNIKLKIGGTLSGLNAGKYIATFTPTDNYCWSNGTTNTRESHWYIQKQKISNDEIPKQAVALLYNEQTQSVTWTDYDSNKLSVGGITSAKDPVSSDDIGYAATFTPTANYCWSDGTSGSKIVYWRIDYGVILDTPYQVNIPTYSKGKEWTVELENYDQHMMTLEGELSATNAGNHYITVSLKEGFVWNDTHDSKNRVITWVINRKRLSSYDVPTQTGTLTYNTESQSPTWSDLYDTEIFTIGGVLSATDAGTYDATFIPTENYCWPDGKYDNTIISNWVIDKMDITTIPSQSGTLSYDGTSKTPTWDNYDEIMMTISGTTSGTEVNTYTAIFTPTSNYKWYDNTQYKEVTWSISKAEGIISIDNSDSITITESNNNISIVVNATGPISAVSNNTSIVKVYELLEILPIPSQSGTLTYDGTSKSPTWDNYDESKMTISGTTSGTEVNTYTATFTTKEGYKFSDNTTTTNVEWSISKGEGIINIDNNDSITITESNNNISIVVNATGPISAVSNDESIVKVYELLGTVDVPSQNGTIAYDGTSKSPVWNNYDSNKMTISGINNATEVGTYTATFKLKDGYKWSDNTTTDKEINWVIDKMTITNIPSQNGTLTYDGTSKSPTWNNYDEIMMTISGTTSATDVGTYTVIFTPNSNYKWYDNSEYKEVTWSINKADGIITVTPNISSLELSEDNPTYIIEVEATGDITATSSNTSVVVIIELDQIDIPSQSGTITYDGTSKTPTWDNYDSNKLTISGTTSATNVGTYTAVFKLKDGYIWPDGTITDKSVTWNISKAEGIINIDNSDSITITESNNNISIVVDSTGPISAVSNNTSIVKVYELLGIVDIPSQNGTITYDGTSKSPVWNNFDSNKMTISGTTSGTNADTYTATFKLREGYKWSNNTTTDKEINWVIDKMAITNIPSQSNELYYDGTTKTPTWDNYYTEKMTISGTTSATDGGTYTAIFTPTSNYKWYDNYEYKEVTWTISSIVILPIPSQNGTLTYDGTSKSPTWDNYDESKMTISGTTSGTEVNTYTATFTTKEGYKFSDNTTSVNVEWSISKGEGIINIDNNDSITITESNNNISIVVNATGPISAVSNDTSIVKVYELLGTLDIPSQNGTLTYDGTSKTPTWDNYDSEKMTISGINNATDAGTYTSIFTLNDGYKWSDDTTTDKEINWVIDKMDITTIPSQSGTLSYDGTSKTPTWNNYDSNKMTISGTTSGIEVNTYTVTFTPTSNYKWSDDTYTGKEVTWTIGKGEGIINIDNSDSITITESNNNISIVVNATGPISAVSNNTSIVKVYELLGTVDVPSQSDTLTYDGTSKTPTWDNYDESKMTISGTSSATDVGTYTATFTTKDGYKFTDNTTTTNVEWSIGKGEGILDFENNITNIELTTSDNSTIVTVYSTGPVTAISNDTNIVKIEEYNE